MGLRFHKRDKEAQPIAGTNRTGAAAGWSIRTWTGQIAPPQPEHDEPDDEAVAEQ